MIVSGRCHGPGCQQATDLDFCSERCLAQWHAQLGDEPAEAAADDLAGEPDCDKGCTRHQTCRQVTLPAGGVSEFPQVASPSPQVTHTGQRGWLGRWLHRMRRTP
jgi:hypothetical protein